MISLNDNLSWRKMYKGRKIKTPYFGVNPKSYIYGDDVIDLAIGCDKLAQ